MNNFQMEIPLEQRDRLRVLDRQRELAMKKRLGEDMDIAMQKRMVEDMDRERLFLLERERAAGLSERLLDRDRMGHRMVGMNKFLEMERDVRLAGVDRPVVVDRRLEGGVGVDRRLESGVGVDRRLESGVERRLEIGVDRNDDREGARAAGRPSSFDRLRPTGRERDEEREKVRARDEGIAGEKQKERDVSPGAIQELVAQYKTALGELTFNSKPIITNLTIIAGENVHAAKGIAATVCAHILEVPNDQKLPSLYLLDSIVKNIGGDYVKHFAARLPEVFCKAYKQVDPSTHPSMQHLFKTWRGVFPGAPLRLIETELLFSPTVNTPSSSNNPARPVESPSQRSGHSIHVNPKYLEAQRQRLQQSSRAEAVSTESNGDTSIRELGRTERVTLDSPKGWPDTKRPPLLPRTQRGDSFGGDLGYGRKTPVSISDYDYGPADPGVEVGGGRVGDKEAWEKGWAREEEDVLRPPESGSGLRYAQRNGYEVRQPSPRALVDAYGNIRGPRALRMPPPTAQPVQDLDRRGRGPQRNWQTSEEEEYIWEDMSPRLVDHARHRDTMRKDDWYLGEVVKDLTAGGLGRGKPMGLDPPLPDHLGWHRHAPLHLTDRPTSAESRFALRRELDERIPLPGLQQDTGRGVVSESALEVPVLGPSSRSAFGHHSPANRLPHSLPQQLSPPAQSRLRPLLTTQPNRNPSPTGVGSLNLLPVSASLSANSAAPTGMGHSLAVRAASVRPPMGSSLGGGLLSLGSLSPMAPASNFPFQQRQHPQRPPSPTLLAPPPQLQLPLPTPTLRPPQPNFHLLQHQQQPQHANHLKSIQHQGQALGMHQPPSSQQHSSVHSPSQHPQRIQLFSQQAPAVQQPVQQPPQPFQLLQAQPMQPLQLTSEQPLPPRQSSHTVPMLPQLPTQLLRSLQQLQQHLPPFKGSSVQQTQASQPQQLQALPPTIQSGQSTQTSQQQQQSPEQQQPSQPPSQPQQLAQIPQVPGYVGQPMGSVTNDTASSSVPGPSTQNANSLLAAFLQSGIMPPSQASQMLSHQHPSSPKVSTMSSESTPQVSTQIQPPLPSGRPPAPFSASSTGPSSTQGVISLPLPVPNLTVPTPPLAPVPPLNLPTYASQPMRLVQPPLPPGPPPASSQVVSSGPQPSVSGGILPQPMNNLTSLLSSLMAQGVISAAAPAPSILPQPSGAIAVPNTTAFPNSNAGSSSGAPLVPLVGLSVPAAATMSTTLVTALRTREPPTLLLDVPSTSTAMDPIGTEFKQDILRERHESVMNALYLDFPRQCKTCGLRFKSQEDHSKHMDWHVSRNRRQKSLKKVSRKWFVSMKEWLSGTGVSASEVAPSFFAEDVSAKSEEHERVAVPADENQSACALCGEPFEDFYSDETEEWMYKGAVYMNAPPGRVTEGLDSSLLGPIVHAKCRSESAATDSAEDDEGVQAELLAADSVRMDDLKGGDNIVPLLTDSFDTFGAKEVEDELGHIRKRVRY